MLLVTMFFTTIIIKNIFLNNTFVATRSYMHGTSPTCLSVVHVALDHYMDVNMQWNVSMLHVYQSSNNYNQLKKVTHIEIYRPTYIYFKIHVIF